MICHFERSTLSFQPRFSFIDQPRFHPTFSARILSTPADPSVKHSKWLTIGRPLNFLCVMMSLIIALVEMLCSLAKRASARDFLGTEIQEGE